MNINSQIVSPEVFLGLDEGFKDKVRDRFIVGSKYDLEIIALYFLRYYKVSYNLREGGKIQDVLSIHYERKTVDLKRWIVYFAYRTGKYTFESISRYFGLKSPKGHGVRKIAKALQDELSVNRILMKKYEIHHKNLEKLFITFKLATI